LAALDAVVIEEPDEGDGEENVLRRRKIISDLLAGSLLYEKGRRANASGKGTHSL